MTELDVEALQRRLADFAAARHWQPFHTPKNLVSALSVEASELLEIFQWLTPEQSDRVMHDPDRAHRVTDEVADVLAYLLQLCEVLGIDPLAALAAKIDRNELRFPVPTAPPAPQNLTGPAPAQTRPTSAQTGRAPVQNPEESPNGHSSE
ncbi:nucleotide pyrophosphohydrolase [Streptomyces sp. NBC_00224]|uniref:Nucleotide pyrophosphohydrolase n=1 Tax=Streptomyces sp. NBC_00060 TaxID=2975636 RepID=A0AAU2GWU2_9ACTN